MRKYCLIGFLLMPLLGCDDSSKLWESIGSIEARLTSLEKQCAELNTNISSIQAIVEAVQKNDYITDVAVVLENGVEVGYKISFSSRPAVIIFHGKNNAGIAPVIGMKQADDGFYYWTQKSNGGQSVWVLDEHGNKVKVTGLEGQNVVAITPQLKIEAGNWMLSVDEGATWKNLGSAKGEKGDSFFANITNEDDRLVLELEDGTVIELPKKRGFSFSLDKQYISNVLPDHSYEVNYTITGAESQNIRIETVEPVGWEVVVQQTNAQSGKIVITPSSVASDGKILLFATNGSGDVCMQSIHLQMNIIITVDAWAHFAYVTAQVLSKERSIPFFEYKQKEAENWQRIEGKVSGQEFKAKISGLESTKEYVVRSVVGDNAGGEVAFTTERAEQIPYSNFDTWYMRSKNKNEYGTPGVDGEKLWDTGNEGGAAYDKIPTKEEKDDVVKGSACRLTSEWALVKFAAGSVYTGRFLGLMGLNAKLDFGIPYTCRPTQLKGYYKYNGAVVNRVPKDGSFDHLKGLKDSCHILIALCDWKEAFHALPPGKLADYSRNNPEVLAYGELKDSRDMSSYEPFTIDIEWRDTSRKPTYIVIVATSSKYGGYFAGGEGSTLLIDEFELGFD